MLRNRRQLSVNSGAFEEHYGVVVNDDDYVVSYESFADNVMPTVVVTPR